MRLHMYVYVYTYMYMHLHVDVQPIAIGVSFLQSQSNYDLILDVSFAMFRQKQIN